MNDSPRIDWPRIGLGIDVHRLEPGRPCTLGGVTVDSKVGPVGHSDGDAVLHALCDAVLGACGLDDLGSLFSDQAEENAGRASAEFCSETMKRVRGLRYCVWSLDVVVETEAPKLMPHRAAMRARIAELFAVPLDRVNLKGKTGENVGPIGRGEAMRATAMALVGPA